MFPIYEAVKFNNMLRYVTSLYKGLVSTRSEQSHVRNVLINC